MREEFDLHGRMVTRLPMHGVPLRPLMVAKHAIVSTPLQDEVPPKYTVGDYYAALHVRSSIKGFLTRAQVRGAS